MISLRGMPGGAAHQRADAGQHFFHVEGLGDIVVGAGIDALHLVAPAVARGQQQHRHGLAGAAPFLEHRQPVHLRQADIEHHRVVGFGVAEEVAFLAVERDVDRIAGLGQRFLELAIEIGVVFNDENAHRYVPFCRHDTPAPGDSRPYARKTSDFDFT